MSASTRAACERDDLANAAIARLPIFSSPATCGQICSADLAGTPIVLYFYPKDATSGCTAQAQGFRDAATNFARSGVRILGVSRDSLASHERFRAREKLPFDLIADTDESLCTLFDVVRDKKLYGRTFRGIVRSTFLFNARGELRHAWRGAKVPGHVDAVLQAAQAC